MGRRKELATVMAAQKVYFVRQILPAVKRRAQYTLWQLVCEGMREESEARKDFHQDCRATAWLHFRQVLTAGNTEWTPGTIARYACAQVKTGRLVHCGAPRSIDNRPESYLDRKGVNEAPRVDYHDRADGFVSPLADPAVIVAYRHDYRLWVRRLTEVLRKTVRAILERGGQGEDGAVARSLGISGGRLSQRRKILAKLWRAFTADDRKSHARKHPQDVAKPRRTTGSRGKRE